MQQTANPSYDIVSGSNTNWINDISNIMQSKLGDLLQHIYNATSTMLHNGISYTIIALIVMFWLLKQTKNGYPSREELFSATQWLIMTIFVYAVYSSFEAFAEFLNWLSIPTLWVRDSVYAFFEESGEPMSLTDQANNIINEISRVYHLIWEASKQKMIANAPTGTGWVYKSLGGFISWFDILPTTIWLIAMYFLIFALIAVILVSGFMAMLILSFAPIMVIFLSLPRLKGYFFSWFKVYIAYSLYAPLALLVLTLALTPIKKIMSQGDRAIQDIVMTNEQCATFLPATILAFVCIGLLKRIPNWINQILSVQGLEGGGTSAGSVALGTAGAGLAGGIFGGIASRLAGGSFLGGFGRGLVASLPGSKTIGRISDLLGKKGKGSGGNGKSGGNIVNDAVFNN